MAPTARALAARALRACGAAALVLATAGSGSAAPAVHMVTIDGFAFKPPVITVRLGDTVEWRNTDPVPHTATAKDAGLDSGEIAANGTWRFTAKKKGRFAYICTLHPIMKGELVVE
ncbi:MAG TPA: cupredoxin family copper-binding protein [Casimicrobiaceae bacterium]